MSMPSRTTDPNVELARAINQEARANPASPYAGKFVGIAQGRVVVADSDFNTVQEALHAAEPDRLQRLILEASADHETPHEIWRVR